MSALLGSLFSLEGAAVVLALCYLLLAARENPWCWLCAFISSGLYCLIFWQARLYMETALNVFYVVMAVLGWWQWLRGGEHAQPLAISSWRWQRHLMCAALVLALALGNGWVMQQFTDAVWPFVDAFITWASVLTTWLVVRKVLENWLYWIVIDGLAAVVYLDRGLTLTALLYAAYVVLVVFGYLRWRREYRSAFTAQRA